MPSVTAMRPIATKLAYNPSEKIIQSQVA